MLYDMFHKGKFIMQLSILDIDEEVVSVLNGFESIDGHTKYYKVEE